MILRCVSTEAWSDQVVSIDQLFYNKELDSKKTYAKPNIVKSGVFESALSVREQKNSKQTNRQTNKQRDKLKGNKMK